MKKIFLITLLLVSSLCFAGRDKGVRQATLAAGKTFNLSKIDQVGSTVKNIKTDEILRHHCIKREKNGECSEIIHILSTENKDLILHDRKMQEIKQNVTFIKERLAYSFRNSMLNFTDFDPVYNRSAGDFTGYIGAVCIFDNQSCGLLLLLPVAIAADLVMLPIDITINESQRLITRKNAKIFIQNLESDQEQVEFNNRSFLSLLKGLSQF